MKKLVGSTVLFLAVLGITPNAYAINCSGYDALCAHYCDQVNDAFDDVQVASDIGWWNPFWIRTRICNAASARHANATAIFIAECF